MNDRRAAIEISQLSTRFGDHVVHAGLDLRIERGEIFALIGGSGSGKSTLLREMILLHRPDAGTLRVLGVELRDIDAASALALRLRWGVMFQHGGLFGSLTVLENIGLPLREHSGLDSPTIDRIAGWKLAMTGLAAETGALYPAELSAGLDPASAGEVDHLIRQLHEQFGLTIVIITHDLDLLWQLADRVAVLADGKVAGIGTMHELARLPAPAIRSFFDGPRGRAAATQEDRLATTGQEASWKTR